MTSVYYSKITCNKKQSLFIRFNFIKFKVFICQLLEEEKIHYIKDDMTLTYGHISTVGLRFDG